MKSTHVVGFVAACVAGYCAAHPSESWAAYRTMHALNCLVQGGGTEGINSAMQVYNPSASSNLVLMCPMVSDTSMSTNATTAGAEVDGWQSSSNGVQVVSCVTWQAGGGAGGKCDSAIAQLGGSNTAFQMKFTPTSWKTAGSGDYAYLMIAVLPMVAGANVVFGYALSN